MLKRVLDNRAPSAPPINPPTDNTLNFGQSKLFDFLYERMRWGMISLELCHLIAMLALEDFEEFKDSELCVYTFAKVVYTHIGPFVVYGVFILLQS
jgi:hypothetical protein